MAKPSDPRPPAIPSPAPDRSLDDSWEGVDAKEIKVTARPVTVIEDSAPPITHWDLLSEERIPSMNMPRLPAGGGVLPITRPSMAAIPAAAPPSAIPAPAPAPPRGLEVPDSLDQPDLVDSLLNVSSLRDQPADETPVEEPQHPDTLARLLAVPSPASRARLPAVGDQGPADERAAASLEQREMALAEADDAAAASQDSLSEWVHPPPV
ncbi:MAG: hypothetical protein KDA24_29835, partial [Deltaproteobacteria bacterium]|nr:hypothetical protein [Deltaproteobacteria bacterium]